MYQIKNNLAALPPLPKLSVGFQRNRLPDVQDVTFFNVRPSPKFCLINLFMSSLSPAASLLAEAPFPLYSLTSVSSANTKEKGPLLAGKPAALDNF